MLCFSQIRRLEVALSKEKKQQTTGTDGDASANKKRDRDSENGDSSVPRKIKANEKLRGMDIRQLREEAALRGVSETGSKKEILERLCEDSDEKDLEDIPQGMDKSLTKKKIFKRLYAVFGC